MYQIYYTNFGYYSQDEFDTLAAAIAHGKSVGFDFTVSLDGEIVASWSYFGGLRHWQAAAGSSGRWEL